MDKRALLCVTVSASTLDDLVEARTRAERDADLVELRLDGLRAIEVRAAIAGRRCPVIVTCRPPWEGGRFDGSEEERRRILTTAIASDAEYVDLEWRAGFEDLVQARRGRGIVLSAHDLDGMPADLEPRLRAMAATGAEVIKIAATISHLRGLVGLRDLGSRHPTLKLLLIGLGPRGVPSRVLASRFGSAWTYAGREAGTGQLTPEELLDVYRFRRLGPRTAIYGLTGHPIDRSLSPLLHNAGFEAAELDAVYVPFPASDADDVLAAARALGVQGLSVTTPLKVPICERLERRDDWCASVGAANTIRRCASGWEGTNTDVAGFLEPLQDEELEGLRATVVGAGGAARAVVAALRSRGAQVTVAARRRRMAARLAGAGGLVAALPLERADWDLLVNTTPVGSWPEADQMPVAADLLAGGRIVYDLVYQPPITRLMREAVAAGCRAIGGIEMLIAQAERQFAWWTGQPPAAGLFRNVAHASYIL
jgi:3-dehydroquinate dehydratase / shikimate dehydrogenase